MTRESRRRLRNLGRILIVLYVLFLIYFTIFSDWYGRTGMEEYHYNLQLFHEIRRFWTYRAEVGYASFIMNIAGNVAMFIPFGVIQPLAGKKENFFATVLFGFLLSLCIETFQLLTKVGSFDVDDLFLNTIGALIGYLIYMVWMRRRRIYGDRTKVKNRRR